jgi:photosynthetic reaction center cytochrome c subunit
MNEVKRKVLGLMSMTVACLFGVSLAYGQAAAPAASAQKPQMSEDAFKNIQVLRGIPVKEFMDTMGFFAASLGLNCTDCHGSESAGDWSKYAADNPLKDMARRMVVTMNAINKADFGGTRSVTCYTCHRGSSLPKVIPSLAEQNSAPPPEDPDEIESLPAAAQGPAPSADQILDRYIQAVGGTQQLAKLKSFSAKGTYQGFDTDFGKVPVDVFAASAPYRRATVIHLDYGDSTATYDGQEAWAAAPSAVAPVPVIPLLGGYLEGAKVDAQISFPGQIKQDLKNWRVGFPEISIDNHPAQIVEGTTPGGIRVKLYFDKQSGLLVRQVRYINTAVGITPSHIEYSDYRDVAGVKMPFHWTVTWVDGNSTFELSDIQPNTQIAASKFAKPAAPAPKSPTP